jgi:hypothetical protein
LGSGNVVLNVNPEADVLPDSAGNAKADKPKDLSAFLRDIIVFHFNRFLKGTKKSIQ